MFDTVDLMRARMLTDEQMRAMLATWRDEDYARGDIHMRADIADAIRHLDTRIEHASRRRRDRAIVICLILVAVALRYVWPIVRASP